MNLKFYFTFFFFLLISGIQVQAQIQDTCIWLQFETFDPPPPPYIVGDVFTTQGQTVTVIDFFTTTTNPCSGPTAAGGVTSSVANEACGSGNELLLDQASIHFDWPHGVHKITFRYGYEDAESKQVNLSVNTECVSRNGFVGMPNMLGGVRVSVFEDANGGCGVVELEGEVFELTIGGENLAVDDLSFCANCSEIFRSDFDDSPDMDTNMVGDTLPDEDAIYITSYFHPGCTDSLFDQVEISWFTNPSPLNYSCGDFKELEFSRANCMISFPALPPGKSLSWQVLNWGGLDVDTVNLIINTGCISPPNFATLTPTAPTTVGGVQVWSIAYPTPKRTCGRLYAAGAINSYEIGGASQGKLYIDDVCAAYTEVTCTNVDSSDVSCNFFMDGSITVGVSGGTAPYSFTLNTVPTTPVDNLDGTYTFMGLGPGVYTVEVTDANGCMETCPPVTIIEPDILICNFVSRTNPSCFGATDGSITVMVTGGTPPYSFTVNGNPTIPSMAGSQYTFSGLGAGTYTIGVKDANGCMHACDPITLTEPEELICTIDNIINLDCNGDTNGSITIKVTGGTMPYSFTLNGNPASPFMAGSLYTFSGLGAGTYTIVVTDANGCMVTCQLVELIEPDVLICTIEEIEDLDCFGNMDGSITIRVTGGTMPYAFTLNAIATSPTDNLDGTYTFSGLGAGTYTIVVIDANGCIVICPDVTLTEPDELVCTLDSSDNLDCNGDTDGSITVMVTGGTMPYSFTINGNPASPTMSGSLYTFSGLGAGTYTIVVTDANGCMITCPIVTLGQPDDLVCTIDSSDNLDCNGDMDGSITVMVTGGTMPYTFTLNGNPTIPSMAGSLYTFSGLGAGTYTIVVTDARGCVVTCPDVTLTQPELLTCTIEDSEHLDCFGDMDGSITIRVAGGTMPYAFTLNAVPTIPTDNFDGTYTFSGLTAGTYTIVVTDANGCMVTCPDVTLTEPEILWFPAIDSTQLDCNGDTDATLFFTVTGGTMPYAFTLNGSPVTPTSLGGGDYSISGLGAGDYTVCVTDANGCMALSPTLSLTEPAILTCAIDDSQDLVCFGDTDGSITIEVTGGTLPYSFTLNGPMAFPIMAGSLYTFTGLGAGTYTIVVTDGNGCTVDCSPVTLTEPPALDACDARSPMVVCEGGSFQLDELSSEAVEWLWSSALGSTITPLNVRNPIVTNVMIGDVFTVIITDINGCKDTCSTAPFVTPRPDCIIEAETSICKGDILMLHEIGNDAFSWSWSSDMGATIDDPTLEWITATNVSDGETFTVTIVGANNCESTCSITIEVNDPECMASNDGPICEDGTLMLHETGPDAVAWSWSSNMGATIMDADMQWATATNVSNGEVFTVEITDANGCTKTCTTTAVVNPLPYCEITQDAPLCEGGSLMLHETGGDAVTWFWSSDMGAAIDDPTLQWITATGVADDETFTVTITDVNGCVNSCSITVTVNELPECWAVNSGPICKGDILQLNELRGLNVMWSWSSDMGATINGADTRNPTAIGVTNGETFMVTITDANGCQSTCSTTATVFDLPDCNAGNDGPICRGDVLQLFEDAGDATEWFWSSDGSAVFDDPTLPNPTATNVSDGETFTVVVTDENGCSSTCSTSTLVYDPQADPTSNSPICEGLELRLYANASGGLDPLSYDWSGPDGFVSMDENPTIPVTTLLNAGVYYLTVTDDFGCTATGTVDVIINANLSFAGEIEADEYFCGPGHDPEIITEVSPPSGDLSMISFFWMKREAGSIDWELIPGATGRDYDPGPIYVTTEFIRCVVIAGCETIIETNVVTKTVGDEVSAAIFGPDPAVVCRGVSIEYSTTTIPGATYFWNFGEDATPQFMNTPTANVSWSSKGVKTITLNVSTSTCSATNISEVLVISNQACGLILFGSNDTGNLTMRNRNFVEEEEIGINVFPNPFVNQLLIQMDEVVEERVEIRLRDLQGKLLKTDWIYQGQYETRLDLQQLSSGMYFLMIQLDNDNIHYQKVIKQ